MTSKEFKQEVNAVHNGSIEVVGRYKNLVSPIIVKDKYGLLKVNTARQLLKFKPDIRSAMNKTEYFMNMMADIQPEIHKLIKPLSEYKTAKERMIFDTKFGAITTTPDSLLAGHGPSIRGALDRKEYFRNQLLFLYGDAYDFKVTTSDRHGGKSILICPEHGEVVVDNDWIFMGNGCPKCNQEPSTLFYLVKLTGNDDEFFKLGISAYNKGGKIKRFDQYKRLGYEVEVLKLKEFDSAIECREFETKLKKQIKPYLITPKVWEHEASTECFRFDIDQFIEFFIGDDIV